VTVDTLLQDRDAFLADVRERLLQAQAYAKRYYDAHHRHLELRVDDWVLLRLLHRPAQSLVPGARGKLSPRYAGPFQVVECVGDVAYRLRLPEGARIHDVFHIGVLKPFHGTPPAAQAPLPPLQHGRLLEAPERALRSQLRLGVWHVLIKWAGLPEAESTWEPVDAFREAYPEFQLEDELFVDGGSDVMVGQVYERRKRARG
jgi:hypothetical protein